MEWGSVINQFSGIDPRHVAWLRGLMAPASKEKMAADGVELVAGTPGELDAFMKADMAKWGGVIKTAKIRPD